MVSSPLFNGIDGSNLDWVDVLDIHYHNDGSGGQHNDNHNNGKVQGNVTSKPIVPQSSTFSKKSSQPSIDAVNSTALIKIQLTKKACEISAEARALARSERKRSREKQRRSDVNSHFAILTEQLRKIDADESNVSDDEGHPKQNGPFLSSQTNRIDLIARATSVLNRIQTENRKRGRDIVDLRTQLLDSKKKLVKMEKKMKDAEVEVLGKKAAEPPVMMMVPMMMRPDGGAAGMAMSGGPGHFMPYMYPQNGAGNAAGCFPSMYNPYAFNKNSLVTESSFTGKDLNGKKENISSCNLSHQIHVPNTITTGTQDLAHCA